MVGCTEVGEEAVEEAELEWRGGVSFVGGGGGEAGRLTCQAKGRFFRFKRA